MHEEFCEADNQPEKYARQRRRRRIVRKQNMKGVMSHQVVVVV
jgi:hypothetical protein